MEIALSAVTDAGRSRMAAVSAEVGAHVVLLAAQQVAARPFHVTAESVLLSETGEVRLLPLPAASPHEVELELRQLLAGLLGLAPAAPPALKAAAERSPGGGLAALEAELQAALIPINHAAARRALARLFRETRRASATGGASPEATPTPAGEVTPIPPGSATTPTAATAVREQGSLQVEPPSLDVHHAEPVQGDLDIDVDVVDDDSPAASSCDVTDADTASPVMGLGEVMLADPEDPPPTSSRATSHADELDAHQSDSDQHVPCRSDVGELLESFLAHTRSEVRMSEDLRRMLGVERGASPSRGAGFVVSGLSSDAQFRR